jgi:hypothetical protein
MGLADPLILPWIKPNIVATAVFDPKEIMKSRESLESFLLTQNLGKENKQFYQEYGENNFT